MATYNLNVTASVDLLGSDISGSQSTDFAIANPLSGSSYFTFETVRNSDGFYTSGSVKGTSGSFSFSSGISNLVADDYKMSAVVLSGGASLTFIPAQYVSASQMYVRGTGGGDLILPPNPSLILEAYNLASYPGTGTTWFDISGNGNNATLNNDPTWNSAGYFELDGINDWVNAVAVGPAMDGAFTIETIIWPTVDSYIGGPGGRVIWSTHDSSYNNKYIYYVVPNTGQIGRISGLTLTPNTPAGTIGQEWKIVSFVHDGTNMKIYINGVLQNTHANVQSSNFYLSLGQEYDSATPTDFYLGKYGGAKVYDRALNEGEIWTNYQIFKQQFGV